MNIAGTTALITGGARRIGREIALTLARQGASVAITYRSSQPEAEKTVREIESMGTRALAVRADIAREEDVRRCLDTVQDTLGEPDILINNAAIFEETPFEKLKTDDWDRHMDINLKGTFLYAWQVAQGMQQRERGKIINIADWSGLRPYKNYLPYCVSKAGVIALTQGLAIELAPAVQVNCICPGPIMPPDTYQETQVQEIIAQTPLGRIGSPQDIAEAVLFLIQGSDFVTGVVLPVDGGRLIA